MNDRQSDNSDRWCDDRRSSDGNHAGTITYRSRTVTADPTPRNNFTLAALAAYVGIVAGAVAIFLVIRRYGEGLTAPARV